MRYERERIFNEIFYRGHGSGSAEQGSIKVAMKRVWHGIVSVRTEASAVAG